MNLLDRSRYWQCSNHDYHADLTHDSHSSLDLFMRSVEQYAARRVFNTVQPPPPTEQMEFGSLFHSICLEHDKFDEEYILQEKFDRRTKKGKIGWADFLERAYGKKIVEPEDVERAYAMRDGVDRNAYSSALIFDNGISEVSMQCVDQETGLPLKIRIDRLSATGEMGDLKSTNDVSPSEWSKTVYKYGYHRQAAMYLDCARQYGIEGPFTFIAVSKEPPHEAVPYRLDENAVAMGRAENGIILRELKERWETGDWHGRWSSGVQVVGLPRYAYSVGR